MLSDRTLSLEKMAKTEKQIWRVLDNMEINCKTMKQQVEKHTEKLVSLKQQWVNCGLYPNGSLFECKMWRLCLKFRFHKFFKFIYMLVEMSCVIVHTTKVCNSAAHFKTTVLTL